jgi:hypothetical protein
MGVAELTAYMQQATVVLLVVRVQSVNIILFHTRKLHLIISSQMLVCCLSVVCMTFTMSAVTMSSNCCNSF